MQIKNLFIIAIIILTIIFLNSFFYLLENSIKELDIQKYSFYYNDNDKIEINCYRGCSFMNLQCVLRGLKTKNDKILFKNDVLACNINYSIEKSGMMKRYLWLISTSTDYIEEKILTETTKQLLFNLNEKGEYEFWLQTDDELPKVYSLNIYAFESVNEYENLINKNWRDYIVMGLGTIGIIISIVGIYFSSETMKIESKNYSIRVRKKKRKLGKENKLKQKEKE